MTRGGIFAAAALLVLTLAPPAHAQVRDAAPLLISPETERPGPRRMAPPLDPARLERLRRARALADQGQLGAARDSLTRLLGEVPHHPRVLGVLAEVLLEKQDYAAVQRLAVAERLAHRDSLLLARALALAHERLGRPGEASAVAVEAWVVSPAEGEWANETLLRLAPVDGRAGLAALARAVGLLPARADLARTLARLQWRGGDMRGMLRTLAAADHAGARVPLRWTLGEELLRSGAARDSTAAVESFLDMAGDRATGAPYRSLAARRAWELFTARHAERAGAPRIARALQDLPAAQWDSGFLVAIARSLREAGLTAQARALLPPPGEERAARPEVVVERALADLRDGPPERALPALRAAADQSPEGAFRYAEALFFAGQSDSAAAWYQRISADPSGEYAGAALERLFLLEDAAPAGAFAAFGSIAYERWRGETRRAAALTDSLVHALPRGSLWAAAALILSDQRDAAGDYPGALEPLLAVADSLPGDRLAPLARQKAGDLYLTRLKDEARALAQYEECLARYPKAWNAPEVRRRLEQLRRDRRL